MMCKTNSMEQRPWEGNSYSASQEIPHIVLDPKVHYRILKSPPLVRPSNSEALRNIS